MQPIDSLRQFCRTLSRLVGVVSLAVASSCSQPPDPRFTNFEIRGADGIAKYDPKTGRLQRLDIDHNKDGKIETFSYWDGPRALRIEIDSDGDGRIDRWEHYGDGSRLIRVGSSRHDDGIEDTWTYPDSEGHLAKVESDTNRDGVIDKRETYAPGGTAAGARVLAVVDFDFDRTGRSRLRLHYRPDGTFERAETPR